MRHMASNEKWVKTWSEDSKGKDSLGDRTVNGIVTEYTITFIGQTAVQVCLTLWRRNYFFLVLAHSVHKM